MKMKFLAVLGCMLLLVSCGGRRTATAPAYRAFPLPDVPAMISDMQERQEYIAAHYWDGFFEGEWPTDSAHVLAELEQNISAFIMFLEALPMDRAQSEVARLFGRIEEKQAADTASLVYLRMTELVSKYLYDPNSPLRSEDFYLPFVEGLAKSRFTDDARRHRALLDEFGYTEAESILDEWNYVRGWSGEEWKNSLQTELSMKGAAMISAVMAACQREAVDMLMYYDARINSTMNGLFSFGTLEPLKGYHALNAWGELLAAGDECKTECDVPDIYAAAAVKDGKNVTVVTYYTDDEAALPRSFTVELPGDELRTVSLLDESRDMTPYLSIAPDGGRFTLTMQPNTVVVIK